MLRNLTLLQPGEVALPGGKVDPGDESLEYTARREAYEEIGLPMEAEKVRHLCNLPPFLARSAPLLVTPVVCYILDPTLKPKLNPREVSNVFSHPLYSFLTETPPSPHYVPHTVYNGTRPYRLQYDIKWLEDSPYRMFRFEGRLNPIWGFTADMLIHVAMLAYKREPDFQRKAPGQMKRGELIRTAQRQLAEGKWPWPIAKRKKDTTDEDSQDSALTRNGEKSKL
jgi:coenzyme A diphosphatase NUDT7